MMRTKEVKVKVLTEIQATVTVNLPLNRENAIKAIEAAEAKNLSCARAVAKIGVDLSEWQFIGPAANAEHMKCVFSQKDNDASRIVIEEV